MKYSKLFIALAVMIAAPALGADVGVSISIGQPGFYGQLDLGNYSRPPVIYSRPVVIQRAPRGVIYEPLYLRVPPGHSRNWRRHCSRYDACGRPVYFVKNDWYNNVYAPRYREQHRRDGDDRRDYRRDDQRDDRRDRRDDRNDNRDDRRDDRNGRDNDRGRRND